MVSPEELIQLAEQLCANSTTSEAASRAAASRAYYAAYHACTTVLEPEHDPEQQVGMHRQYIKFLRNHPDRKVKQIGLTLSEIYKTRISADYRVEYYFADAEAIDAVSSANILLKVLPTLA